MTTASGSRTVPAPADEVWRALALLRPYCAVCDVSYVVDDGSSVSGPGTTFRCVPGRLENRPVRPGAPHGEIVEWNPPRRVTTRLELTPEIWTSRIELADDPDGGTQVTLTLTHQPRGGNRALRWLQRGAIARLVQRTVDSELAKLPAHLAQAAEAPPAQPMKTQPPKTQPPKTQPPKTQPPKTQPSE